jgi:ABC-type branched-subunit amino acid transport system ATPase component
VAAATGEALEQCGITSLAKKRPADLSSGQRRLVELARVIAGDFRLLLLDEPSSGLDRRETVRFGEVLESLVSTGDKGILLVEHDMSLVMKICGYIHVLDFGQPIFEGTAEQVRTSDLVRAAYLGTEEVEEAVLGREPSPA